MDGFREYVYALETRTAAGLMLKIELCVLRDLKYEPKRFQQELHLPQAVFLGLCLIDNFFSHTDVLTRIFD